MSMKSLPKILIDCSLSDIANYLQCQMEGADIRIDGFNLCNREIIADSVISYCASERFMPIAINNAKVKALIVSQSLYDNASELTKQQLSFIISETPEWSFYRAFIHLIEIGTFPKYDWETSLEGVSVGEGAIIERGVTIGKNVTIGSNSVIKSGTVIDDNVVIGTCSVIGSEGFQLIKDDNGTNHTILHTGRTYIGKNASLGDNVTISKSLFEGFTYIGENVKIDNQVHIGHNCIVDENSVITANSTMFGSSSIGKGVWIAPHCAIMNRVHVGDNAFVCACSFVWRNVKEGTKVGGNPAHRIND